MELSKKYSPIVAGLLAYELTENTSFADEVRSLIDEVGPHIDVVQRIEIAHGVTGAEIDELVRGTINVEQDVTEAHNLTGFKAKKVGG